MTMSPEGRFIKGRFAPSPTGELHLGNARTALLAWLWTRAEQGAHIMRLEDIDLPRVRPAMAQQQLGELSWLGLDWDEGPYFQSQRTPLFELIIDQISPAAWPRPCAQP